MTQKRTYICNLCECFITQEEFKEGDSLALRKGDGKGWRIMKASDTEIHICKNCNDRFEFFFTGGG